MDSSCSSTSHLAGTVHKAWASYNPIKGKGWKATWAPVEAGEVGQMRVIIYRASDALKKICGDSILALRSPFNIRHQPFYSYLLRKRGIASYVRNTAWIQISPWTVDSVRLIVSYLLATEQQGPAKIHRERLERLADQVIEEFKKLKEPSESEEITVAQLAAIDSDWLKKVWGLGLEIQIEALRLVPAIEDLWLLEELESCSNCIDRILEKVLPGPGSECERELSLLLQIFGSLLDRMAQVQESWLREDYKARLLESLQKIKLQAGMGFGTTDTWRRLSHRGVISSNSQLLYLASCAEQAALRLDEDVGAVSSTANNVNKGIKVAKEVGGVGLKLWSALRALVTLDFEKLKDKAKAALEKAKAVEEVADSRKPRPDEWYPWVRYLEELTHHVVDRGSNSHWATFQAEVTALSNGDKEYKCFFIRRLDQESFWPLIYTIVQCCKAIYEECPEEQIRNEAFEQLVNMFIDQFKPAYRNEREFGVIPAIKHELMRIVTSWLSQHSFSESKTLKRRLRPVMPKLKDLEKKMFRSLGQEDAVEKILAVFRSFSIQEGPAASEHGTMGHMWEDLKTAFGELRQEASELLGLTPKSLQALFLPHWMIHYLFATAAHSPFPKQRRENAVACLGELYRNHKLNGLDSESHMLAARALLRLHSRFDGSDQRTIPAAIEDELGKCQGASELVSWCNFLSEAGRFEIEQELKKIGFEGEDKIGYWLALEDLVSRIKVGWWQGWDNLFYTLYALCEARRGVDPIRIALERVAWRHKIPLNDRKRADRTLCEAARDELYFSLTQSVPREPHLIASRVLLGDARAVLLLDRVFEFLGGDQQLLLLTGDSGAGKSVAMAEVYRVLRKRGALYLPVHIPLDMLCRQKKKVSEYIADSGIPAGEKRVVFLLDAYDSLASSPELFDLDPAHWPEAKFIVTCQPHYLTAHRPPFFRSQLSVQQLAIIPFNSNDRKRYLIKRMGPSQAEQALERIVADPVLAQLTLVPINLAAFVEVRSVDIRDRLSLFQRLVDARFENRLGDSDDYRKAKAEKQKVCEQIAFYMLKEGLLFVNQRNLRQGEEFQSELSFDTIERWLLSNAAPVLRGRRAAPLCVDADENISFEHETLRDYFAACAFVRQPHLASRFPVYQYPSFCQFARDFIDRSSSRAALIKQLWSAVRGDSPIAAGNGLTILNYLGENGVGQKLEGIVVKGADLRGFSFYKAELTDAQFINCLVTDTNFDRAILVNTSLEGIDHQRSVFIDLFDNRSGYLKADFAAGDGALIALTSEGRVWKLTESLDSGNELFVIREKIREAVLSPDGCWLAYCTKNGFAVVYDLLSRKELWRSDGSRSFTNAIPFADAKNGYCWFFNQRFSENSRLTRLHVATGDFVDLPIDLSLSLRGGTSEYLIFTSNEKLFLYDTKAEQLLEGPQVGGWISAIVPSPSGNRVAVANSDGLVVWDHRLNMSTLYPCSVRTLSWAGGDEAIAIAVGVADNQLNIINVTSGDRLSLHAHSVHHIYKPILSLGSGLEQGDVMVLLEDGSAILLHIGGSTTPRLSGLSVAPDALSSGQLATCGSDVLLPVLAGVFELNPAQGRGQQLALHISETIDAVAYSLNSHRLAAVSGKGNLFIWDCSGNLPAYLEIPDKSDKVQYIGLRDQANCTEDDGSDEDLPDHSWGNLGLQLHSLSFSPDGKRLLTGSHDIIPFAGRLPSVAVWDCNTGSVRAFLLMNPEDTDLDPPHCAGWIDDSRLLFGSSNGLDLFDLESQANQTLVENSVLNLAASTNYQCAAVIPGVRESEMAMFWNFMTSPPSSTALGRRVSSFTFGSRDLLVGGSRSGDIYLWNLKEAEPLLMTQLTIWNGVRSLVVSEAGDIVIGDLDGGLLVFAKEERIRAWGVVWQQGRSTTFLNAKVDGLSVTPKAHMRVVKQTLQPWHDEWSRTENSTDSDADDALESKSSNHLAIAVAIAGLLAAGLIARRWHRRSRQ